MARFRRTSRARSLNPFPTVRKTARANGPKGPSALEKRFARLWSEAGGGELVPEFRFHPTRRWRADFAHHESRTLIEIEGGAFGGRHTRPAGFVGDCEKYFAAYLDGWSVVRLCAPQLTPETIRALAARVSGTK